MISFLRANVGLTVWFAIFFIAAVVSTISVFLMTPRGL